MEAKYAVLMQGVSALTGFNYSVWPLLFLRGGFNSPAEATAWAIEQPNIPKHGILIMPYYD